jgi:hypothetical protein
MMQDEIDTGWRRTYVGSRLRAIRALVETRWSPAVTAAALVGVAVKGTTGGTPGPSDTSAPAPDTAPTALDVVGA